MTRKRRPSGIIQLVLSFSAAIFVLSLTAPSVTARTDIAQEDNPSWSGEGKPTDWDSPQLGFSLAVEGNVPIEVVPDKNDNKVLHPPSRMAAILNQVWHVTLTLFLWRV